MTDTKSRWFTLEQLQEEQVLWVQHNFPDRPSWMPLMGVCEEVTELARAHANFDHEEILDAIGDIVVFASDYCSAMGWDMQAMLNQQQGSDLEVRIPGAGLEARAILEIYDAVGTMQHSHLKMHQKIRGTHDEHVVAIRAGLVKLLSMLKVYIDITQIQLGLLEIVEATWADVKVRDWRKARQEENWA
jgi:hypothetical protein